MTLVKRMPPSAEPHEYCGFRDDESGSVYIVAAHTHNPVKPGMGGGKEMVPETPPLRAAIIGKRHAGHRLAGPGRSSHT
jgi:hypothetical protein